MRINSLDGLRGFAVILVLVFHSFMPFTFGGFIGVDIFFVLSGFLITTLLLKEYDTCKTISFRNFYMRRALRLAPALIIVVTSFYIYSQYFMVGEKQEMAFVAVLGTLFYIANLAVAFDWFPMSYLLPTWSLSIEEQFYFFWPILLLLLLNGLKNRKNLIITISLIIIFLWINRTILVFNGASINRLYFGSDTHFDGLFVGCLSALLIAEFKNRNFNVNGILHKYKTIIPVLAIGFYVVSTIVLGNEIRVLYIWYFPLLEIVSAVLISFLYLQKNDRTVFLFSNKFLTWLGKISYGLYLWHWFIYRVMSDAGATGGYIALYGAGASILIAALSYYLIEKPILKMKKRFYSVKK